MLKGEKMEDEIRDKLFQLQDLKYKEFHSNLCPNVDDIIGVRVPLLRTYAKEIYKNNKLNEIKIGNKYLVFLYKNQKIKYTYFCTCAFSAPNCPVIDSRI